MNNDTETNSNLTSQTIEAILFATAEEHSVQQLAQLLEVSAEEIGVALVELSQRFEDHGIMLLRNGEGTSATVTLVTRPAHSAIIEQLRKEELQKELSKSSAETLAIVVYRPGATKADIELIRGVNASYSLRALHIRGLIETKNTGRTATYYPTLALLESFGVESIEQLPQYIETKQKIEALLSNIE